MNFIRLGKERKADFIKILNFSFGKDIDPENTGKHFDNEEFWKNAWGIEENNELVSCYVSYAIQTKLRSYTYKGRYIPLIATLPSFRNRGYVHRYMEKEIEICEKENTPFVFLDPFKHSYYRKMGFETAFVAKSLTADWEFLTRDCPVKPYNLKEGYLSKEENLKALFKNYREKSWEISPYNDWKQPDVHFARSYFQGMTKIVFSIDETGAPVGYIIYGQSDNVLEVYQYRFFDLRAFYTLKKYILNLRDQVTSIKLHNLQPDFPIDLLVHSYWNKQKSITYEEVPHRMMRIINVKDTIEILCTENTNDKIILKVVDPLIERNNRNFEIFPGDKVQSTNDSPQISINVSDLSPLVTGMKSARQLYLEGKLTLPEPENIEWIDKSLPEAVEIIDKIFPERITHIH